SVRFARTQYASSMDGCFLTWRSSRSELPPDVRPRDDDRQMRDPAMSLLPLPSRSPVETLPRRMGPLAKLPVFLDLSDRRAIIVGGSAGAAWKAELLASSGARVEVFCEAPSNEMLDVLGGRAIPGTITLHRRTWLAADFEDSAIAIADLENE